MYVARNVIVELKPLKPFSSASVGRGSYLYRKPRRRRRKHACQICINVLMKELTFGRITTRVSTAAADYKRDERCLFSSRELTGLTSARIMISLICVNVVELLAQAPC